MRKPLLILCVCLYVELVFGLKCHTYWTKPKDNFTEQKQCKNDISNCDVVVKECTDDAGLGRGHGAACMAVWKNDSITGLKIMMKDCWHYQLPTDGNEALLQCDQSDYCENDGVQQKAGKDHNTFFCCCTKDNCNEELKLKDIPPTTVAPSQKTPSIPSAPTSPLTVVLLILIPLTAGALLVVLCFWAYRKHSLNRYWDKARERDAITTVLVGSKQINNTAGNGPQRSIQMIEVAGMGRFGQVWRATMNDQMVAVKVFPHQDADSWVQEQDIYAVNGMKAHGNILHFIGAEVRGTGPQMEYWLITTFHWHGSLMEYLKTHTLTIPQSLHIAVGLLRGLTFLHEEINLPDGTVRKPTIVHRDFKSRNVLLHDDLSACISDFGLALKCEHGRTPHDTHAQVGTRRYMSPEVLEGATEFSAFAFRQIDVYAAALVLWEVVSRTQFHENDKVPDYRLPFEHEVGDLPALNVMQEAVVTNKMRPKIESRWRNDPQMRVLCNTIEEMWDTEPEARITAGCAFERVASLTGQGGSGFDPTALYIAPNSPPIQNGHVTSTNASANANHNFVRPPQNTTSVFNDSSTAVNEPPPPYTEYQEQQSPSGCRLEALQQQQQSSPTVTRVEERDGVIVESTPLITNGDVSHTDTAVLPSILSSGLTTERV